ncbi:MAG: heavy metal translocating P-type ATPase [Cohaesibacter sp.]|jgi:Cu+-exporting ATPase|nr:heavy metal translocating P-type ATPase [Cohaesibacter sp.]
MVSSSFTAHANTAPDKSLASVAGQEFVFDITGMHCAACSSRVERVLNANPYVTASVNLALERADITASGELGADDIKALIEKTGFGASLREGSLAERREKAEALEAGRRDDESKTFRLFLFSLVLTLPLVLPMVGGWFGVNLHLPPLVQLLLALPVQVIVGWRFYVGSYKALRSKAANMDVLVALGTSAAFFFSLYQWLELGEGAIGHLYFEASAAILTLILFGKWLEGRARRGAADALRALMTLRPQKARLVREGQADQEVAIESVQSGDHIRVQAGEVVPVDGLILEGTSEFDEALLSGESVPVLRKQGDKVVTGAVNGLGSVVLEVTALGEDTVLAKIIRLVDQAQTGRAKLQTLADRVSAIFVPVVVVLAVLTCLGWLAMGGTLEEAIVASVSVLVIACPCALGLATPTALVAGTGAAARHGILIRDIDALEEARTIETIIFDKTGTLTKGEPGLSLVLPFGSLEKDDVLLQVAAVQKGSEHPLAKASLAAIAELERPTPAATDINVHIGQGVEGLIDGKTVLVGKEAFLRAQGVSLPQEASDAAARLGSEGQTLAFAARDGELIGVLAFMDQAREESRDAIAQLKAQGLKTGLLSGDNEETAARIGGLLGVDFVKGNVSPHGKLSYLQSMQEEGKHVAMVGDGLNDAPALAAADLGLAMGSGTDVAIGAAAITLMRPDPRLVASALDIARRTHAKIWQNLFWAFIYNVIGIPLAAFGLLNPALAGAAMAFSSVSVVSNALLLRRWKG